MFVWYFKCTILLCFLFANIWTEIQKNRNKRKIKINNKQFVILGELFHKTRLHLFKYTTINFPKTENNLNNAQWEGYWFEWELERNNFQNKKTPLYDTEVFETNYQKLQ